LNELTTASRLSRIRATAYSKLTLALRVVGARDDGYHEIDALAISLGQPHDVIEIAAVPHPGGVTFDVIGETEHVPTGLDNLAARAAEDLLLRAGRSGHGLVITLRKRIPAGAGLGGGSADAAATLVAVRRMLEVDIDDAGLDEVAAGLGSDVPFCLRGGAARMRGRGEQLDAIDLPVGMPFLVAIPPFRLATPAVYAKWDELGGPSSERIVPAPPQIAAVLPELVNDLEPAAEALEPDLRSFRVALEDAVGHPAILAGSGSAYAVPLDGVRDVNELAGRIGRKLHAPVVGAASVSRGVRLTA
jgi:4-diphosphocytidyl-2-C-methyl-D-erythritol kinase